LANFSFKEEEMLSKRNISIALLLAVSLFLAVPHADAGFAVRLEKEVPKKVIRGIHPISVAIYDSRAAASPVATQTFSSGELMISVLETLSGAAMYRVRMDFTATEPLTMGMDLWWEFSLGGNVIGKRERVPQSAWSLFSVDADMTTGIPFTARNLEFCDGTNNGALWYDTAGGGIHICIDDGVIEIFAGAGTIEWRHVIFHTSKTFLGSALGGLSGADAKCQAAGDAGSATSSMGATWKALLSSSTVNAKDRVTITAPIVRVDKIPVAAGAVDLWDGTIQNPISMTEHNISGSVSVWTGTWKDGTALHTQCSDWLGDAASSAVAGAVSSVPFWMYSFYQNCGTGSSALYCISSEPVATSILP